VTVDGLPRRQLVVVKDRASGYLPYDQKVCGGWFVLEDRCSNEIVVNDLRDLPTIHVAQQERLGITRIQDRRLAKVELPVSLTTPS
jgi:hypothetical protein